MKALHAADVRILSFSSCKRSSAVTRIERPNFVISSEISGIESRVEANLFDLIRNYVLVMDCTSATKPATIAYYKLAVNYHVPLVYVYEKKRELTWIISKGDLRKKLIGGTKD